MLRLIRSQEFKNTKKHLLFFLFNVQNYEYWFVQDCLKTKLQVYLLCNMTAHDPKLQCSMKIKAW